MVPRSWAGEGKNKSHPNIIYFLKTYYVPGILSGMLHLPAHRILLTALKSGYYYYLPISHEETASQRSGDLPKLLGVTQLGFQPKFSPLCYALLFSLHIISPAWHQPQEVGLPEGHECHLNIDSESLGWRVP